MTAILAAPAAQPGLDMGWTIQAVLRVLWRRGLDLFVVGALFVILPQFLAAFLPQQLQSVSLVFGLPSLVFAGAASLITFAELTAAPRISAREAITRGAQRFGSLWAVGFISGMVIGVGTLLLIIPGLFALVSWIPATATVMVEGTTAMEALTRAWRRTRGSRWRLAGLSLLVLVALALAFVAIMLLDLVLFALFGQQTALTISDFAVAPFFAYAVVLLMTVFSAVAYTGLRPAAAAEPVAEIFA
jgi:hypothetical protein